MRPKQEKTGAPKHSPHKAPERVTWGGGSGPGRHGHPRSPASTASPSSPDPRPGLDWVPPERFPKSKPRKEGLFAMLPPPPRFGDRGEPPPTPFPPFTPPQALAPPRCPQPPTSPQEAAPPSCPGPGPARRVCRRLSHGTGRQGWRRGSIGPGTAGSGRTPRWRHAARCPLRSQSRGRDPAPHHRRLHTNNPPNEHRGRGHRPDRPPPPLLPAPPGPPPPQGE